MRPQHAFIHRIGSLALGEFDLGGVLYHGNYFRVFERAREAFLASRGYPYSRLIEEHAHLVVNESYLNYDKPVRYGEPVTVYLWSSDRRRTSAVFNYELTVGPEGQETTVHTAWTRLVYVKETNGELRPNRLPPELLEIFSAIEHDND